jgi:hypothetical protein
MTEPSKLVNFYFGYTTPEVGVFAEIVEEWSDDQWEMNHDFIQWLFPLKTPSNFNPDAPILTDEDIDAFNKQGVPNKILQKQLMKAFERFLTFVGLTLNLIDDHREVDPQEVYLIEKGNTWADREWVWKNPNHNWLRITRVIASLRLLRWEEASTAFFECIQKLYNEGYGSPSSFKYWQDAAEGRIE